MSALSATKELFLIKPAIKATATVIFLHGLGDNGNGWMHAFDEIKRKDVRYLFPNAPSMPVTVNGGFVMPSWYDLKSLDRNAPEDESGIKNAAEKIRRYIKAENEDHGIPFNRIILGGFSMGGSLSLYTALTYPQQLGGLIVLSSWMPLHKKFTAGTDGYSLQNQKCKIFQGHGSADPMVPVKFGSITHEVLKQGRSSLPTTTQFKIYSGFGHEACDEEMNDVKNFIESCVDKD